MDTLQYFTIKNGLANYVDSNIVMQAARFEIRGNCVLKEIIVTLGGKKKHGGATVHVYGNEGSAPYPIYEKDLLPPIRISKNKTGIERVQVLLPQEITIDGSQFFIAIDSISDGVTLLTDKNIAIPRCTTSTDYFGWQFVKDNDAKWKASIYSYAITAIVEYPNPIEKFAFADITSSLGLLNRLNDNHGISWGDIDNDNFLDLLSDGRLYSNDRGEYFHDITNESGIKGNPKAQVFIDVNNDQLIDILFIGSLDTVDTKNSKLFVNQGNNFFTLYNLSLPVITNPTSISIADADGNGFLDVYIGQYDDSINAPPYLLFNQGNLSFIVDSIQIDNINVGLGSQWIPPILSDTLPSLLLKTVKNDHLALSTKV